MEAHGRISEPGQNRGERSRVYNNVPAEVDEHLKQFIEVLQKTGFVELK